MSRRQGECEGKGKANCQCSRSSWENKSDKSILRCICRRKNRSCTDFEPHLAGKITAVLHMDFWEFYVENHVENRYNYF